MILISYDIADDKKRSRFNKFIRKFGFMLQYSVYEITNSESMLDKIIWEIEHRWEPTFDESDSVIIIKTSKTCRISKFGYAKHDEDSIVVI
ncbi:CRISPR-associated endonuclease Cas2 [Veillonella sp. YH-vei2232]|jgi:CRISPR-associated protein Cas2|uniref:CRISPR-associated endoribonuclease Cas2 n=1 Tax=Veillonella absiana TaxID=3079305 RepID=A0ABU3ZB30_9FIRM|nr:MULTISPECIES: CRISPR-associated endonuclease Cas2 [unclassified Veillonella]MDV5064210.1 CRISPR-associated endonuclease Cas2 [Veillonella sp. YH-vei2232]MDV5089130.1 CRISPR-associated endonuclease Cas2 [Veillonella sp. YH-vei2233]NBK98803.1 CRISPR-associated endonuclease Cas2 [Erysipelotrichia bacterium]